MFNFLRPIFFRFSRTLLCVVLVFAASVAAWAEDAEECHRFSSAGEWYAAFTHCKRAAEQGVAAAQDNLGWMYDSGEGVAQNYREAVKWYRLAAKQGDASAQNNLGTMYYRGDGVSLDKREAVKWFRLAAEQGYADAQFNLGVLYDNGWGVAQDKRMAVKWYRLAAEQGDADAQVNLGLMYGLGEGVIQDDREAYIWFSIAALSGDGNAVKGRELAESKLSKDEIRSAKTEAQKRLAAIEGKSGSAFAPSVATAPKTDGTTPAQTAFGTAWRSVVLIETKDNQGSGVILRPNVVATNCHVIEGADDIAVYKAANHSADQRINKTTSYAATIRKFNFSRDLCLLTVQGLNGQPAQTRSASALSVGENVFAIGAPEGLDYSVSAGIVSQLRRNNPADAPTIQTDAAISPGSSGGALADAAGNVVGLTTRKLVDEEIEGIAFALPIEWALELLQ